MEITLRQIKYFIAAAETGKIATAASLLSISPSSVTEAIKELEKNIGVSLITRHRTGINLTFDGYRFLQHSYDIMASVSNAAYALKTSHTDISGKLRVGVTITVSGYFMASPLARFSRTFPHIEVNLFEYPREQIETMLMEGKLDIAILLVSNVYADNFESETLVRSTRRLWTSENHRLGSKQEIFLNDISDEPYIQLMIDEAGVTHLNFWKSHHKPPKVSFRTESVEAVRSMVALGSGVTILSDMVYRPWSLEGDRIKALDVKDGIPSMDVGLLWAKDRKLDRAAKSFIDFFKMMYTSGDPRAISNKPKKNFGL
jgi:DNA-binding transcriptional LysR family regulator